MIKTFVKKPVEIQAVQWNEDNYDEICNFIGYHPTFLHGSFGPYIIIKTLEGNYHAFVGDYIIRGIKGEFYPCKPDIFEQTYEEVSM